MATADIVFRCIVGVDDVAAVWPVPVERQKFYLQWVHQMENQWNWPIIEGAMGGESEHWQQISEEERVVWRWVFRLWRLIDKFAARYSGTAIGARCGSVWVDMIIAPQVSIEMVHAMTYGRVADVMYIGVGTEEQRGDEVESMRDPLIRELIEWASSIGESMSLVDCLLGAIAIEAILLQTTFMIPYAWRKVSKFDAAIRANEYIARDELDHFNNYSLIWSELSAKPEQEVVWTAIKRIVGIVERIAVHILPKPIIHLGLDAKSMVMYAKLLSNKVSKALGYDAVYAAAGLKAPSFMDNKNVPQFASFHTTKPTTYRNAVVGVGGSLSGLRVNSSD